MFRQLLAASFAVALSLASSAAFAETIALKAELKGSNESPPNDSKATGMADVTLDTTAKTITWTVSFSGLSGPVKGAHIHGPADQAANAGIMIPFTTLESPIEGSGAYTDAQAEDILAGRTYVNIHTEAHPGGEIRGQLMKAQ